MKKELLIADDDPVVRHLLSAMLTGAGYAVKTVGSGQECMQLISSLSITGELPQLIFLDLQLADVSGAEVLLQIRAATPHRIPVVLISAQSESEARSSAPGIDADAFLEKPFSPEKAIKLVSALLKCG